MAEPLPSPALLRGDMQAMLTYIQGARIVSMARETAISRLKAWLIYRFWFGIMTAAVALIVINLESAWLGVWSPDNAKLLSALVLLMLSSRVGAIVSIGRRMTSDNLGATVGGDSIYTLAVLGSGKNGLALALLSSNVFGLVMFAFFASGLPSLIGLTGGIAPTFTAVEINRLRDAARDEVVRTAERAAEARARAKAKACDVKATPTPSPSPSPSPAPSPTLVSTCTALNADAVALADRARVAADRLQASTITTDKPCVRGECAEGSWLESLRAALALESIPDLFKLLLWAFVAGFFEQFVPDMLNNLATRSRETKKREEDAAR